jgi:hypothetical protein
MGKMGIKMDFRPVFVVNRRLSVKSNANPLGCELNSIFFKTPKNYEQH